MSDNKNNTGNRNSGYRNSGDRNSGYWNSGNSNSGNWNSGYSNSGYSNSGNSNSGYCNSGNWNSGWFNTNEPNARFFNKDTDMKLSDFYNSNKNPHWAEFYLTKWIGEEDMTDEEKKDDPDFYIRSGQLKTYTYKEAWSNFWKDTDEKNRQKILNLPNFDSDIFKEITGIDVSKKESKKKQKLLDKADELIQKAEELKNEANNL